MNEITSLEFTYQSKTYHALIRTKKHTEEKQYVVTVMNGPLEKLLYGYHIFTAREITSLSTPAPDKQVAELRNCIAKALYRYLQVNNSTQQEYVTM